ncbi:MAG: AMP-binding protein [Acidimicrobiales bacterium]|nr:AMP-binding protein [Acidimicrobiales bacterium]
MEARDGEQADRVVAWSRHLPADTDPATVDLLVEESLPRAWRARWAEDPRAVVALTPAGHKLTAAQLDERSAVVAGRLARAGLEPGDRVIVSALASLDLVVAYVAALRMRLIVVPMNTAYGAGEIRHIVASTTPKAAVVDDRARGDLLRAASPGPLMILGPDVALPGGPPPALDLADRGTPTLICLTSGTTGAPKGAVLSSGNLLASAEAVRLAWRWAPDDRLALMLPLFHMHGLGVGLHGTLLAGASAVLVGSFDTAALDHAIAEQSASMFFGVPTMYHRIAQSPVLGTLGRLRLCVSGSAPLSAELHRRVADASGQRILERYGMTETVMNLSNPYDGERRPGTVGIPLPGVEMRLEHADDDPTGPGEIQLRGPNVFAGYLNDPEATAATFTADGWFRTGDIGELDDDGYVSIVGRSKELIISGGYNVYPREIEDVLRTHPAVDDVAVVGTRSDEWGETVTAVVVAHDQVTADELTSFAARHLAPFKRPRVVRFVDELPRNALGKVLRNELVD